MAHYTQTSYDKGYEQGQLETIQQIRDLLDQQERGIRQKLEPRVGNRAYERPVKELVLSVKLRNLLRKVGVSTVQEVYDYHMQSGLGLEEIRGFGPRALRELSDELKRYGLEPLESRS